MMSESGAHDADDSEASAGGERFTAASADASGTGMPGAGAGNPSSGNAGVGSASIERRADGLRRLFLWFLSAGALGIAVGWLTERLLPALGLLLTVAAPLSAMGAYIYYGISMDRSSRRSESFADSIYYMGFLLTLVALIFSMFSVAPEGGSATGLVFRFGVALLTTVVGLAARTYFANFRITPEDELRRLRSEEATSARELRDKYRDLSEMITLQMEALETSLQKANSDVRKASGKLSRSVSSLEESVSRSVSDVEEALTEPKEKTSQVSSGVTESLATSA